VLYQLSYMGTINRSFKPDNVNEKNPFPLIFLSKPQEATGYSTFYGLPTADKLRNNFKGVNRQFLLFAPALLA
jgi:hypothetical protein